MKNVCTTPVVAGQWQKNGDRLDVAIVNSGAFPEIKTTSKLLPLGLDLMIDVADCGRSSTGGRESVEARCPQS